MKYFLQTPHCSSKPRSSYEDIPVPRRILEKMAVSHELGKNRAVEDGALADMPADVDTANGLAAGAELAIDGTAMEPEVGVGNIETTGNRFLIRVAAEDLVRLSRCNASA